jgi:hypothetical protein
MLKTEGQVTIEDYCSPQFTQKRRITTSFHIFQKRLKDRYDFILGHALLKDLKIVIDYGAFQFIWDGITISYWELD